MTMCVLSKLAKVETVYFRFRSTFVTSFFLFSFSSFFFMDGGEG